MSDNIYTQVGTVQGLESWIGLAPGNQDEALLTTLLGVTSQDLQSACGRSLSGVASYTDYYTVPRSHRVMLLQQPAQTLTSVGIVAGQDWPSTPVTPTPIQISPIPQDGFAFLLKGMVYLPVGVLEDYMIQVIYTAGFASTPPDFIQAVYELAGLRYRQRQRIGEKSKNLGGEVVSYETARWNDFIEDVVSRYKSKVFTL